VKGCETNYAWHLHWKHPYAISSALRVRSLYLFMQSCHSLSIIIFQVQYLKAVAEILVSRGGDYEDDSLLTYSAVQSRNRPAFQSCVLPPSKWRWSYPR
jgi:hypothetical protein